MFNRRAPLVLSLSIITIMSIPTSVGADSRPFPASAPVTQFEFAGETCTPAGQLGATYTYPDGVHSLMHPPDPLAVAGQRKIQSIIHRMIAQQQIIVNSHVDDSSPQQKVLNGYVREYNSLLTQYDTCVPN